MCLNERKLKLRWPPEGSRGPVSCQVICSSGHIEPRNETKVRIALRIVAKLIDVKPVFLRVGFFDTFAKCVWERYGQKWGTLMKDLTADFCLKKWEWVQQTCTVLIVSNATLLTFLGPILSHYKYHLWGENLLAHLTKKVYSPFYLSIDLSIYLSI